MRFLVVCYHVYGVASLKVILRSDERLPSGNAQPMNLSTPSPVFTSSAASSLTSAPSRARIRKARTIVSFTIQQNRDLRGQRRRRAILANLDRLYGHGEGARIDGQGVNGAIQLHTVRVRRLMRA